MEPYLLRIMEPGSAEDVIEDFLSDRPFGSVAVGDLLDLQQYRKAVGERDKVLRVVRVEHQFYQSKSAGMQHNIRVFTEEVPDTPEVRLRSGR